MCSHAIIIILLYSTLLLLLLCNVGKSMENMSLIDKENANANQFLDSMLPHFEHFGTPYKPLELVAYEQGKEQKQIIKRNMRTGKVEWRLAEINRNMGIKEWTSSEFSMLDERNARIYEKKLASAMTDYANCVKKTKMIIKQKEEKTKKIFMLNGAITILNMKPIARKDQAYLVKYVPEFLGNEQQIMEAVQTHFCTSLFIVENDGGKINVYELVCTQINRWTEKNDPSKNIGKKATDCGHSELHDHQLLSAEHLKSIGFENMLEFVQIKLAMDLAKILKRFEVDLMEEKHQKKNDQNVPTTPINPVVEHQIATMDPNVRIYKGFMVEYDLRKMVAHWLLERLTIENVWPKNPIQRLNWNWNADPKLAKMLQPVKEDYKMAKQFKLNHGHLASFRAHRENYDQETFLYPNSVPQDREINSGYWRVIEEYALCLAGHKQSIAYIYTGPLYIPEKNNDTHQWQMKYKVIGKKKMMAVPTHLFKIIFLEFINDDGKKSYWLESLVVSNGQEGEVELVEEENVEGRHDEVEEELEVEEEEGMEVIVKMEKGNNIWYILKDEAETDEILNKNSDKGKEQAISGSDISVKKTSSSQKLDKGKGKKNETYVIVKKIDSIKALVEGCQNRRYKINYGDAKSHKISELLEGHRKPLTYIDKFAPSFQLLAKLPRQFRAGKKGSERKGVHFDEDILAKLIEENEKRRANKGKRGKINRGGKANNKQPQQKQKHQQQSATAADEVDAGSSSTANAAKSKLKSEFYEIMEKLYTAYLLNSELPKDAEQYLFDRINLQTFWHEIQSLLQSVKEKMLEDGNTIATAQIDAIALELYKKMENIFEFHQIAHIALEDVIKLNKAKKLDEGYICFLTHLRESIFHTFLIASSHQKQKDDNLRNFALEFEKDFSIEAKDEEYIFSKYDDGTRIAQIWVEKADNFCYNKHKRIKNYRNKYNREMHNLLFSTLTELLNKKSKFTRKLAKFMEKEKNQYESKAQLMEFLHNANYKLMRILGVHFFKQFMREFPKLVKISPKNFHTTYMDIFRDAIFDVNLSVGYQSRKYALQEFLYFFDYFAIVEKIEQLLRFPGTLYYVEQLKQQLSKCVDLESNESSKFLGQALMIRCIRNVYCRLENLYYKLNLELEVQNIPGDPHYFGEEECDELISMHGNMLTKTFHGDQKSFEKFLELYSIKTTTSLVNWAFNMQVVIKEEINIETGKMKNNIHWSVRDNEPNYEFKFRTTKLELNNRSEKFAKNWKPYLLANLADWQNIQSAVALVVIKVIMNLLFEALHNKEHEELVKMFKQIIEKSERKEIEPVHELCKLLVLRQNLHFTIGNMGDEELKNNSELQNLIEQYGQIHKSDVPFDDEEMIVGPHQITMEELERYCHNLEKRQKLFRKHRHELENLVAGQLNLIFFTYQFGMSDYHLLVDLPAKLIKIAGVSGFMSIVRDHTLIMTNFFNMETVHAILYHQGNVEIDVEKAKQHQNVENIERTNEELEKIGVMLDSILFQLKMQYLKIAAEVKKQENVLTNEELEEMIQIERAKTEGMDMLMEWLDNRGTESTTLMKINNENGKPTMKMLTKEEKNLHLSKVDKIAFSKIGGLIFSVEEDAILGLNKIGTDANANQSASWKQEWHSEWRQSTMAKLTELERKKSADDKKGKENEEKGKEKNSDNVAFSSSSSSHH